MAVTAIKPPILSGYNRNAIKAENTQVYKH